MKRLSPLQKIKISRLVRSRFAKRIRRDQQKSLTNAKKRNTRRETVMVTPPAVLSFSRNHKKTVEFLNAIHNMRQTRNELGKHFHVDMASVTDLSVPVAIVLSSLFERWSRISKKKLRVVNAKKWSNHVIGLLRDLGTFQMLGIAQKRGSATNSQITLTPLMSGDSSDGEKLDRLQQYFKGIVDNFADNSDVYAVLNEASENCLHHAYKQADENEGELKRWWAASCFDTETGMLRFFIYDHGLGIPATLPTSGIWESVRSAIDAITDGAISDDGLLLEKAFVVGRTSTQMPYRGKGLATMLEVTKSHEKCQLRVLSGRGEVLFTNGALTQTLIHSRAIAGTLIEWRIPSILFASDKIEDVANGES